MYSFSINQLITLKYKYRRFNIPQGERELLNILLTKVRSIHSGAFYFGGMKIENING